MRYFDNATALPVTYITVSAVVVILIGFLAAGYNPLHAVMDNDIKNKTHNEPKSQLQKFSKSPPPLIQIAAAAAAEKPTEPLSIKIQNITAGNPTSNNISTISIAFDVRNHNQNTILL